MDAGLAGVLGAVAGGTIGFAGIAFNDWRARVERRNARWLDLKREAYVAYSAAARLGMRETNGTLNILFRWEFETLEALEAGYPDDWDPYEPLNLIRLLNPQIHRAAEGWLYQLMELNSAVDWAVSERKALAGREPNGPATVDPEVIAMSDRVRAELTRIERLMAEDLAR